MTAALLTPPLSSDWPIWRVWLSAFHAPALAIADDLKMFEHLRSGALSARALAAKLDIEERAVEAIASLMTQLEFLTLADGDYFLTDVAKTYLLADSPFYWGPFLARIRSVPLDCNRLLASLRRGNSPAEARLSAVWEAPVPPTEVLVGFTRAMHAHSFALAMRVVPDFGLAATRSLLDVGGGSGSYSIAAAIHHPSLACAILDFEAVCSVARTYADQYRVGARFQGVTGNMFKDEWPRGHDAVLMSDIFHDWSDEQCLYLAQQALAALEPGGRILLHEMLLGDAKDGPLEAVAYSVVMIFTTRGRQRSRRELEDILRSAGFANVTTTPTAGGYALVEGSKPPT